MSPKNILDSSKTNPKGCVIVGDSDDCVDIYDFADFWKCPEWKSPEWKSPEWKCPEWKSPEW